MAIARIEINSVIGSNDDLVLGSTVTLTNADEGGELTYEWAILSQPSGAAVVLSSTTVETVTFPINKEGSYLIRLIVNKNLADESTDTVIAAVRELQTGNRIPAAGETTQNDAESGWANTAVDQILQRVTRLTDAGIFVAKADVALNTSTVVHMTGLAKLAEGLAGERYVPTVAIAQANSLTKVDGPLGVMVGDVGGNLLSVDAGDLCRVMVMGGLPDQTLGVGGSAGDPVFVNDVGNLSRTAGTFVRQVGDIAKDLGFGQYDIAISAGANSIPRGNAAGDLGGMYPDPKVVGIQEKPVDVPAATGTLAYYDSGADRIKWGPVNLAFANSVTGTLPILRGGTGKSATSLTLYGLIYADTTTSMGVVAPGTSGQPLLSGGGGSAPAFGALALGNLNATSGLLPVTRGGTGDDLSDKDQGALVYIGGPNYLTAALGPAAVGKIAISADNGGGNYAPSWLPQGTSGQILRSSGANVNPTWGTVPTAAFAQASIPYNSIISSTTTQLISGTYTNTTTSYTAMAQVTRVLGNGVASFNILPKEDGTEFYNRVTTAANNTSANVYIQATITNTSGFSETYVQRFAMPTAHNNNQITGSITFPHWQFFAPINSTYTVTVWAKVGTAGDSFQATDYKLVVSQG